MDRNQGRPRHETNISAQRNQAQTHARISSSNGNEERSPRIETTPVEGSRSSGALTKPILVELASQQREGFSRRSRLTTAKEFGRVFAERKRSADKYFTVLACPNNLINARLGLAVSRRVAKLAVARNRLKRLAREVFRQMPTLPALDFVVLANRAAAEADNAVLRASLARHFQRLSDRPR